jgi:hypothetical protein
VRPRGHGHRYYEILAQPLVDLCLTGTHKLDTFTRFGVAAEHDRPRRAALDLFAAIASAHGRANVLYGELADRSGFVGWAGYVPRWQFLYACLKLRRVRRAAVATPDITLGHDRLHLPLRFDALTERLCLRLTGD